MAAGAAEPRTLSAAPTRLVFEPGLYAVTLKGLEAPQAEIHGLPFPAALLAVMPPGPGYPGRIVLCGGVVGGLAWLTRPGQTVAAVVADGPAQVMLVSFAPLTWPEPGLGLEVARIGDGPGFVG